MRSVCLIFSMCLVGLTVLTPPSVAQEFRIEAESGQLNGFTTIMGVFFSEGEATDGLVTNPSATYIFPGWDGEYDVSVRFCDEDDGNSSYDLSGSSAGTIGTWNGDQETGATNCSPTSIRTREVALSVTLQQGETLALTCQRDGGEPCRVDYFDFAYVGPMPPVGDRAFPGAVGFGAHTVGARGLDAPICVVTNLADGGPGSFRACAEQTSPAYITFAVSGYVDLSDVMRITGNKTIECATAPGDGIVFREASVDVFANNVIVRGCRVWPGNDEPGGEPLGSRDSIFVQNSGSIVRNVVIANNSLMFATDETIGTYYESDNVTLQSNLIAWPTRWAGPEGTNGGFGVLIGDDVATVSAVDNYLAFNRYRNPLIGPDSSYMTTPVEFINNLIYCYSGAAGSATDVRSSNSVHIVGNRYKRCPNSAHREIQVRDDSVVYVSDNTIGNGAGAVVHTEGGGEVSVDPLFASSITPIPSSQVESRVFARVGPARLIGFEIDALEHYVNSTGGTITDVDELGGWPVLQGGTNPPDSDSDGMPDWWEATHCGGVCTPTEDHDGDGYENIEEWFHSFYQRRAPLQLEVDPSPLSSNGNDVLEPGEQVEVVPSWRNDRELPLILDGVASDFDGPGSATYTLLADDASYGTVDPGEAASCQDTGVCYEMGLSIPANRPATHWDASFDETLSEATTKTWTLHVGDSFGDVAPTNPFYGAIETMLHHGVTSGCGGTEYCPTATVNRRQMPVFLLRANDGSNYQPPACAAGSEEFDDVPASHPLCRWIEELADRGVVSGCGGGDYCPADPVTRAQMAIFLLRTLEGGGYTPPPCTGVFNDVPCPSLFANWVEDLADRGIASGCSSSPPMYCPSGTVSRAQMAIFVSNTFGLTLYGP